MAEEHLPVRLSHLLRDCSVGAIVRGPESLMVVQDIRTWDRPGSDPTEREIRYVDRVRSALGIDRALCTPPRATKRNGTVVGWVPALRFPSWTRCMGCGLLHSAPWRSRGGAGGGGRGKETERRRQGPPMRRLRRSDRAGALGSRARRGLPRGRALARPGPWGVPEPGAASMPPRLDGTLSEAERDRRQPADSLHALRLERGPALRCIAQAPVSASHLAAAVVRRATGRVSRGAGAG